jgi:hypothetical protein
LSICVALFTTSKKKAQYYPPTFDMWTFEMESWG